MHRYIIITALFATIITRADLVPRLAWQVDLEDPRTKKIELIYGETIDVQCMFRNYFSPLDLSGAAVTLHARTNGMAASESYQLQGTAQPGGIATVRVEVDAWLPQGLETIDYTLAVVQTNSVNVLRAHGSIYLTGSTAASVNAPVPVSVYSALNAALTNHIAETSANMLSLSNNLTAAVSGVFDFASTNRTERLWGQDGKNWAEYLDSTQMTYRVTAVTNVTPAYIVTASDVYVDLSVGDIFINPELFVIDSGADYAITNIVFYKDGDVSGIALGWTNDGFLFDGEQWVVYVNELARYDFGKGPTAAALQLRDMFADYGPIVMIATNITSVIVSTNSEPFVTQSMLDSYSPPFENLLLYSAGRTNYYPRWSATQNTFIVTGVEQ